MESAGAGRPVVFLGEMDLRRPVKDALQADPGLGPGQRRSGAGVDPPAEGQVVPAFSRPGSNFAGSRTVGDRDWPPH